MNRLMDGVSVVLYLGNGDRVTGTYLTDGLDRPVVRDADGFDFNAVARGRCVRVAVEGVDR